MAAAPMPPLYYLAFALLLATSLLFLAWHCRMSRARERERRALEELDAADLPSAPPSGASTPLGAVSLEIGGGGGGGRPRRPRGAPAVLISALPTHIFLARAGSGGSSGGKGGGGKGDNSSQKKADGGGDCDDTGADKDCLRAGRDSIGGSSVNGTVTGHEQQPRSSTIGTGCAHEQQAAADHPLHHDGNDSDGGADNHNSSNCDTGSSCGSGSGGHGAPCSICLDAYNEGDVVKTLLCGHTFHANCVDVWLSRSATCPLCNHRLLPAVLASASSYQ